MPDRQPAMQFADLAQQRETATLGLWTFLATEVLFFGGIIGAYFAYRFAYTAGFAAASQHTKIVLGTLNTAILLTGSLAIATAVHVAPRGRRRVTTALLAATALLGVAFLVVKGIEYHAEWTEHLVPGPGFDFAPPHRRAAELFFLLYFILTGLHALHVMIGIGAVGVAAWRASNGTLRANPLEVTGLYWHFVDVVWIFLFPLIYLVARFQ